MRTKGQQLIQSPALAVRNLSHVHDEPALVPAVAAPAALALAPAPAPSVLVSEESMESRLCRSALSTCRFRLACVRHSEMAIGLRVDSGAR